MEVPSQDSIEQYYEIQEIEEIPRRIEPSITGNPNKGVAENATYLARCNLSSNLTVQGEILDDNGMEVILLLQEEEPARRRQVETTTTTDRRVIELSDNNCKLALRRQLEMTNVVVEQPDATPSRDDENVEMLRKLPPDTIVTRQEERRSNKVEDSDYKDLTETNSSSSGGSSSTSGCAAAKVKRIPRAVRNKTRETVEVRRNPMRVSKKDVDKDFPRPRQRLLGNNRRRIENYEAGKRTRSSTTSYMNTRSVTRKMYNVGATYQAPTKRDETEWKEWPVHGMHERPVYHPQVGLATEYLGKFFVSLDGLSYSEIVDESEIEVVAVDPRNNQRPSSGEKSIGKAKTKNKRLSNIGNTRNISFSTKAKKSFGTCMHGSLHCVLGYCSQVMTPYKQAAEKKLITPATKMNISESTKENIINFKDNIMENPGNSDKFAEGVKLLEGYAIAMTQSVQNKNNRGRTSAGTIASSSTTYVPPGSQRTILENNITNLPTLRGFPNASLVLLRDSGANSSEVFKKKDTKNRFKLEDASVSKEMLSFYKKLMSADEVAANCEASPVRSNLYTLKRHSTNGTQDYNPKRSVLDIQLDNTRTLRVAKENNENENVNNMKIQQPDSGMFSGTSMKNRSWCTSETSEIAKILSEYNKGATRKSAIQIYGGTSKSAKASLATSSAKHSTKATCFWQKDTEENISGNRSVGLDLSQGKWRKLENTGDQTQVIADDRNASNRPGEPAASSEGYHQSTSSKDRQLNLSVSSYTKEKPSVIRKNQQLSKQQRQALTIDTKPKEVASGYSKDEAEILKTQDSLRELLENTSDQTQVIADDRNASNRPEGPAASSESYYQGTSSKDRQINLSVSSYTRERLSVIRENQQFGKQQRQVLAIDTKPKEVASEYSKDEAEILKMQDSLRELLENTAVLYCAANGIHQDDLSSYINTLDSKQSIQWLETLLE